MPRGKKLRNVEPAPASLEHMQSSQERFQHRSLTSRQQTVAIIQLQKQEALDRERERERDEERARESEREREVAAQARKVKRDKETDDSKKARTSLGEGKKGPSKPSRLPFKPLPPGAYETPSRYSPIAKQRSPVWWEGTPEPSQPAPARSTKRKSKAAGAGRGEDQDDEDFKVTPRRTGKTKNAVKKVALDLDSPGPSSQKSTSKRKKTKDDVEAGHGEGSTIGPTVKKPVLSSLATTRETLRKKQPFKFNPMQQARPNAEAGPSAPLRRSPRKGGTMENSQASIPSISSQIIAIPKTRGKRKRNDTQANGESSSPLSPAPSSPAMLLDLDFDLDEDCQGSRFFRQELERRRAEEAAANAVPAPPSPSSTIDLEDTLLEALGISDFNSDPYSQCLNDEERDLVRQQEDKLDLCLFCHEPLPYETSAEFRKLREDYSTATKEIRFDLKAAFCSLHLAESRVIPLGRHRGYPVEIPWLDMWRTLEIPWIRKRIKRITEHPKSSALFADRLETLKTKGLSQLRDDMVYKAAPGYYGQLGAELIKDYLNELDHWDIQPYRPDRYKPLTLDQYREFVLVPEAATCLIMHNNLSYSPESGVFDDTYAQAAIVRHQSVDYGRVMAERTSANAVKDPYLRDKRVREQIIRGNRADEKQRKTRKAKKKGKKRMTAEKDEEEDEDEVEVIVITTPPPKRAVSSTVNIGSSPLTPIPESKQTDLPNSPLAPPPTIPTLVPVVPGRRTSPRKKQTPQVSEPPPPPPPASQESFGELQLGPQDLAQLSEIEATQAQASKVDPRSLSRSQDSYGEPQIGSQELAVLDMAEARIRAH